MLTNVLAWIKSWWARRRSSSNLPETSFPDTNSIPLLSAEVTSLRQEVILMQKTAQGKADAEADARMLSFLQCVATPLCRIISVIDKNHADTGEFQKKLAPLIQDLKNQLALAGGQIVGPVLGNVEFMADRHAARTSVMMRAGDRAEILTVGLEFGGRVLLKAIVKEAE